MTLRGTILEDAVASTGRHGTVRGLPLKEVLEQVVPELSISCLRLALSTPKVTEQLLKLDEQGVSSSLVFYGSGSCEIQMFIAVATKPSLWFGLARNMNRCSSTDSLYKHARICVMCDSARSGKGELSGTLWF